MVVVISVPRTVADNLDQSDDSSGPTPIDYSEKRSLPISIPDCQTVQHAGERYVVCIDIYLPCCVNFATCLCFIYSVVTVAGICNLVGGGVFLTCHRGGDAGGGANIGRCQG